MSEKAVEGVLFCGERCIWCREPATDDVRFYGEDEALLVAKLCPLCMSYVSRCSNCRWFQMHSCSTGICHLEQREETVMKRYRCRHWCQMWTFSADELKEQLAFYIGDPRATTQRDPHLLDVLEKVRRPQGVGKR